MEHPKTDADADTAMLTKREHLAAMAMQGYCAYQFAPHCAANEVAIYAVQLADAIIYELNKTSK